MMTSHKIQPSRAQLGGSPLHQFSRLTWRGRRIWWVGGTVLAVLGAVIGLVLSQGSGLLLVTTFPKADRLITNERAYFSPHSPGVRLSNDWIVTSGSLFSHDGVGWTGVPDDVAPNDASSTGTDSAVFRLVTRHADFINVTVSFQLRVVRLVSTKRTPAVPYDGVHVFLRYQNPAHLYVVSVYRRDGLVAVKEKIPGGPVNGGSYYTLGETRHHTPMHEWVPVSVSIVTIARNSVRIELTINSHRVMTVTDTHHPMPPIIAGGRVGLRGDNCEFYFRDFTVSSA
jgi:hypothetical protein